MKILGGTNQLSYGRAMLGPNEVMTPQKFWEKISRNIDFGVILTNLKISREHLFF